MSNEFLDYVAARWNSTATPASWVAVFVSKIESYNCVGNDSPSSCLVIGTEKCACRIRGDGWGCREEALGCQAQEWRLVVQRCDDLVGVPVGKQDTPADGGALYESTVVIPCRETN
jgi:hypothetical protein